MNPQNLRRSRPQLLGKKAMVFGRGEGGWSAVKGVWGLVGNQGVQGVESRGFEALSIYGVWNRPGDLEISSELIAFERGLHRPGSRAYPCALHRCSLPATWNYT